MCDLTLHEVNHPYTIHDFKKDEGDRDGVAKLRVKVKKVKVKVVNGIVNVKLEVTRHLYDEDEYPYTVVTFQFITSFRYISTCLYFG